jgi:LmbE family N-acetylglucosaminyl deacetylase
MSLELIEPNAWQNPQRILVILAHPDDPEFFCGATIACWAQAGHHVEYCIITCGDKGTKDRQLSGEELCSLRRQEQLHAAQFLGIKKVQFLGFPDGYLVPNLELRKAITRVIREAKPDVVVTCDPQALFMGGERINHPDHRATGQAVIDAVFPAAQDHLYFPELLKEENLEPHAVREVWVSLTNQANVGIDVTALWEKKIAAILHHQSQISDPQALRERMRKRIAEGSTLENPRYIEQFRRIVF